MRSEPLPGMAEFCPHSGHIDSTVRHRHGVNRAGRLGPEPWRCCYCGASVLSVPEYGFVAVLYVIEEVPW